MTEIKIINLEDIAVGKKIGEEIVIYNNHNIISTLLELSLEDLSKIRFRWDYILRNNNTLITLAGKRITEEEYNNHLNSIKYKAN